MNLTSTSAIPAACSIVDIGLSDMPPAWPNGDPAATT